MHSTKMTLVRFPQPTPTPCNADYCTCVIRDAKCAPTQCHCAAIDCDSSLFLLTTVFSAVFIFIIPVGVPAAFLWMMWRAKSQLPGGKPSVTVLGGAKLCAAEVDDAEDNFGFLCHDLQPRYAKRLHTPFLRNRFGFSDSSAEPC
jgi:hypothetical protein|eukprot:COSAG02_NODE_2730_length_8142_cov_5.078080_2_plen_145_part_00